MAPWGPPPVVSTAGGSVVVGSLFIDSVIVYALCIVAFIVCGVFRVFVLFFAVQYMYLVSFLVLQ